MSARVFIHPRCWSGPALDTLSAALVERGLDLKIWKVGPLATHHRRELVKEIGVTGQITLFQRMDGSQFNHYMTDSPGGDVA